MTDLVRIAVGQFGAALGDVGVNLGRARSLAAEAAARDAELVCLPELCLSGYLLEREHYEPLLDALAEAERVLRADADELGVAIVYGAPRRAGDGLANVVVLHEPRGREIVYAKTHMDVKERKVFERGDEFFVDQQSGIGLACCYDIAFPEPFRLLALAGARMLIVPMAWEVERGFVMDAVVAARAVENLAWVVCANQAGRRGPFRFRGRSSVVDPLGQTIVQLGEEDGALEIVDIDLGLADRLRDRRNKASYPLLDDRRGDLYGKLAVQRQ